MCAELLKQRNAVILDVIGMLEHFHRVATPRHVAAGRVSSSA